jgi:hypothetical protein
MRKAMVTLLDIAAPLVVPFVVMGIIIWAVGFIFRRSK